MERHVVAKEVLALKRKLTSSPEPATAGSHCGPPCVIGTHVGVGGGVGGGGAKASVVGKEAASRAAE